MTKSESEGELASVIAHEIAHVTQNHIARNIENSRYDNYIALGALLAAAAAGGAEGAQAGLAVASASIIDKQLRCLLYTSPSPRDKRQSRMPSSA